MNESEIAVEIPVKLASPFKPSIRLKAFTTPDVATRVNIIPIKPKESKLSIVEVRRLNPNLKIPDNQAP